MSFAEYHYCDFMKCKHMSYVALISLASSFAKSSQENSNQTEFIISYLEISSSAHFSPKRIGVINFLGKRIFEMCICWRVLESPGARSTFGNILPQFSHKGRKYSLVEAIMGSAYLAGYELQLKRNIHRKNLQRIFSTIMKV